METLYQMPTIVGSLREYFAPYLSLLTKPSGNKLFMLILSLYTLQFATSINHLYKRFLSKISGVSLNAYYYLLSETEVPLGKFFQITVHLALSLIPDELMELPIFLIVDDTLQAKFGTHFECYRTLFDHAKHNGTNYLKGHCFVALTIAVPVISQGEVRYLNIPVGYKLRNDESKLKIASAMIESIMGELLSGKSVILLCDSWYPKGEVIETVKKHKNLDLIACVRSDTSIFDLPPMRTGKPGRPRVKGRQLSIHNDFDFIRVESYFIGVRVVLTNLFGDLPVYLTVTTPDILNHKLYRVFVSTVQPTQLKERFGGYEKKLSHALNSQMLWLLPLFLYSFRWSIEVMFYEQKTFWSFGLYRIRSKAGIENFVNFSSLCYASTKILPRLDVRFSSLINESPQFCKDTLSDAIWHEMFFYRFAQNFEIPINSECFSALMPDFYSQSESKTA